MDVERTHTKIKIDISKVAHILNAVAAFTPNEFSGVGFGKWSADGLTYVVYRVEILDIGTHGWTEIRPTDLNWVFTDPDFAHMRLWMHRHPVGDGIAGAHNWSGTDHNTARNEPLGAAFPPTSGWSCSIVLTPGGWTGRVDEYGPGKGVRYVDVVPNFVGDWLPDLEVLSRRAKVRYGNNRLSEIGSGQVTHLQSPSDDINYGDGDDGADTEFDQPWADVEDMNDAFDQESDDGPMHMWLESQIDEMGLG